MHRVFAYKNLATLTPATYIGNASEKAKALKDYLK